VKLNCTVTLITVLTARSRNSRGPVTRTARLPISGPMSRTMVSPARTTSSGSPTASRRSLRAASSAAGTSKFTI